MGGVIAYILVSGDPGYDASVQHGLVAATSDQSSGIPWNNSGNTIFTGATATAIGTGFANTTTIIEGHPGTATSYAAGLARAHNGGGFGDWYLPSKDELAKLFDNRFAIGAFDPYGLYWSSTEDAYDTAWEQYFSTGHQVPANKPYLDFVRAVRSF